MEEYVEDNTSKKIIKKQKNIKDENYFKIWDSWGITKEEWIALKSQGV